MRSFDDEDPSDWRGESRPRAHFQSKVISQIRPKLQSSTGAIAVAQLNNLHLHFQGAATLFS